MRIFKFLSESRALIAGQDQQYSYILRSRLLDEILASTLKKD